MTIAADPAGQAVAASPAALARDPRLDFFRGLAMLIIFTSHMPFNRFALWIPARWGWSDATEIFVFCSGAASAIAFGRSFDRAGWVIGTARVSYRIWQVYWFHIGMFVAIATMAAAVDLWGLVADKNYVESLNLGWFVDDPARLLVGLMTLTYVPNYFDILPMYLVILAMMPVAIALSRVSPMLVFAASVALWVMAQGRWLDAAGLGAWHLRLPAEPWSNRPWFFNPFAWQIVFFTGFALVRGWLPAPPVTRPLVVAAVTILLASYLCSDIGLRWPDFQWARDLRDNARWAITKSDFGLFRYVHFLALAYVAWAAAGEGGRRLRWAGGQLWSQVVAVVTTVGQQSLAVFVTSMLLSQAFGIFLDVAGRNWTTATFANAAGWMLLIATAYTVGWFKSAPWRRAR